MFSDEYINELNRASTAKECEFMEPTNVLCGEAYRAISEKASLLEDEIRLWLKESRETSLAMTSLEQAVMWAERSIVKNGVSGE